MDQLLSALQGAQERRPELRDTSSCFFQQVLSPRRGRRRVATWGSVGRAPGLYLRPYCPPEPICSHEFESHATNSPHQRARAAENEGKSDDAQ